jgi:hypothetical protein
VALNTKINQSIYTVSLNMLRWEVMYMSSRGIDSISLFLRLFDLI